VQSRDQEGQTSARVGAARSREGQTFGPTKRGGQAFGPWFPVPSGERLAPPHGQHDALRQAIALHEYHSNCEGQAFGPAGREWPRGSDLWVLDALSPGRNPRRL
jgi:hypothetical protein